MGKRPDKLEPRELDGVHHAVITYIRENPESLKREILSGLRKCGIDLKHGELYGRLDHITRVCPQLAEDDGGRLSWMEKE